MSQQHKYDDVTHRCIRCGSGAFSGADDDCPGSIPLPEELRYEDMTEEDYERIWKAIEDCANA